MEFEWDEAKNASNIEKHGIDFKDAAAVLLTSDVLVRPDRRFEYGEERFQAIGLYMGREIVVIFTPRGNCIRIISARKAHDNEQEAYRSAFGISGGRRSH